MKSEDIEGLTPKGWPSAKPVSNGKTKEYLIAIGFFLLAVFLTGLSLWLDR